MPSRVELAQRCRAVADEMSKLVEQLDDAGVILPSDVTFRLGYTMGSLVKLAAELEGHDPRD